MLPNKSVRSVHGWEASKLHDAPRILPEERKAVIVHGPVLRTGYGPDSKGDRGENAIYISMENTTTGNPSIMDKETDSRTVLSAAEPAHMALVKSRANMKWACICHCFDSVLL